MTTPLPFLRINSPSAQLSVEQQIQYLSIELNRQFEQLTRWIKDNSDQSVKMREFHADVDLTGHRILHEADPIAPTDGANRRYVDERDLVLQEQLDDITDDLHDGTDEGARVTLQRDLPTVVNDTIEIGTFELSGSGHTFDIAVTVSQGGMSIAKAYTIASQFGINSVWEIALPLVDTGEFSGQNFDLDLKQENATNQLALRLRRTVGTTAGTATIQIASRGNQGDLFRESSATASVSAPALVFPTAILTAQAGNVGINAQTLNRAALGTALTIRGAGGFNSMAGVDLENPAPSTNAPIGAVRFYSGSAPVGVLIGRTDGATDSGALVFYVKETGVALGIGLTLSSLRNLILGGGSVAGASGEKVVVLGTGVAPTTSPADSVQLYSIDQAAGNACLGIRSENGSTFVLFKGAVLTAATGTLANAVVRIAEIEARLNALGFLP
jgi:hypothetical protein